MENLSAEREQPSVPAFTERVDTTSVLDRGGVERLRLPCAANVPTATDNDQVCPINYFLPIYNELLFDIGVQLRERRGGSLSLVSFDSFQVRCTPPRAADLYRANNFLRWLLRTHVCIAGLELNYEWVKVHGQLIFEELPENSRLKKLKLLPSFTPLLPRLRYLEELYCYMSPSTDAYVAAVSTLLRTTTCLTSLIFCACYEQSQPPKAFIDALAANSTLKSLELWANWNTTEPPGCLGEYVRSNRLLTTLMLFSEESDREALLLDEALVRNSSLSTLRTGTVCGGERTARFLTRILAECASLRKLALGCAHREHVHISDATMLRCAEAFAGNETLEELTLPYCLWHPNNWIAFFAFLPKNTHLKKLEVYNLWIWDYEALRPVLEALARTDSSRRVSFECYTHNSAVDLMHFESFSKIVIFGAESVKLPALQRLPSLDHFTCLSIGLTEGDERLFSSLATYIRATTMLRDLRLVVSTPVDAAPLSCWTLVFEAILANSTIASILISSSDNLVYNDHLARTIGLSRYIARVHYIQSRSEWNPTSFVLPLSETIGDNYNLLEVNLTGAKVSAETARPLFTVRETTRRNSGLLERAVAFKDTTPLDWHTANALEKVSRNPGLVRELAEKEGINAREVASMVRSRLETVDGVHDFMRLTGVVKERVTCAPPVDGCSKQLDDLNINCWGRVRRYLSFDDVKRFTLVIPDNTRHS